ncbi:MAG: A/G-specific adenine glycosylase, partial [Alphaproteobacteria bacterium]
MQSKSIPPAPFRAALLAWYEANARPLPWRQYAPPNPYAIWLAEIMLQQTTVAAVIPYYKRFLASFPTVQALAEADIQAVLHHWQGLGYYRRAHLLHACAKAVVTHHNRHFPGTEAALLTLPGIGPYTAAAIASLAFNQPATVVDGNVERVVSRLHRVQTLLPAAKPALRTLAQALACPQNPQAYANAIMELGATVCTPTNPACPTCPVATFCHAAHHGDATTYPRKPAKTKVPHLHATAYVLTDARGHIRLSQRHATGMLGGLWEVLTACPTQPNPLGFPASLNAMPADYTVAGTITHTFSHFKLTVEVRHATVAKHPKANAF